MMARAGKGMMLAARLGIRPTRTLLLAIAAVQTGVQAGRAAPAAECRPAQEAVTDRLDGLGPRGEIRLGSGRRIVLGSLRWPEDPEIAAAASAWLLAQRGHPLTLVARGEADRWGRTRTDAAIEDGATDLAGGLIAAGLAYADADEGDALCRPALLAVEETARKAGLGLWRRPVMRADDAGALRASEGRFTVVQGVLRHVGVRASRTYLDFVRRGEDGLTVTVSKRTWRRMLEHGLSADGLRGRTLRVRGVVENRRGATLDVAAPEAIEVLEEAASGGNADREQAPRR